MTLKNLFFDLDGTILESSRGILNSFRYTFDEMKYPQLSDSELNSFIGPPLETTFARLSNGDDAWAEKAIVTYRKYYAAKGMHEAKPYDGILEMLDNLQRLDYKLYIATSKKEDVAKNMLAELDMSQHFQGIFGNTPQSHSKTLVLRKSLMNTQSTPETSAMIGDRDYDIIGGLENKVAKTIGVLWGFGDEIELEKAGSDIIIAHPQQLLENIR
ncbi:HAD hydrolase-like protein [Lactococcus laudensis]|uniref:HAD hydrolase-like protein n=1 Tax=Pseudolactococcus laudensis TaxID=1494461 RepID=UPI002FC85E10